MNQNTELLHAKFAKKLTFGSEQVNYNGELLFCWPYTWEKFVDWQLIEKLEKNLMNWVQRRISSKILCNVTMRTRTAVIASFFTNPASWRRKGAEDAISFNKLLMHSKFLELLFLVDDTTEDHSESDQHDAFVRSVGRVMKSILEFKFNTPEEIKSDESYATIMENSSECGQYLELSFDFAEELKNEYSVTKDLGQYFACLTGQAFELQTWCCSTSMFHLLNLDLRNYLRFFTGAANNCLELVFLLDGIHVPRTVRDNVYWARCYGNRLFL